jgi:4-diphosphocytidyl-2-C-methyl-D-erythritol kinase
VKRIPAPAKLNLALVVGPRRADGRHEVATVLQRLGLADRITVEPASDLSVTGFGRDTLVRAALEGLAAAAGVEARWRARIEKRIPVASGLGGGSSDAASALLLANRTLPQPLEPDALHALAATLGADVPFFLRSGPALGTGVGADLQPLELPQDFWVVLLLPAGEAKRSTADVYAAFDERDGAAGFAERRAALLEALEAVRRPRDLAGLPPNDLGSSPLAAELREQGAFRADVTGAGPVVYGLFMRRAAAESAARALRAHGRTWVSVPAWYG